MPAHLGQFALHIRKILRRALRKKSEHGNNTGDEGGRPLPTACPRCARRISNGIHHLLR